MSTTEKERLWSTLTPLLCRAPGPGDDLEMVGLERQDERRKFLGMNCFWVSCSDVLEVISTNFPLLFDAVMSVAPLKVDIDWEEDAEAAAATAAYVEAESEQIDKAIAKFPLRVRMKLQALRPQWP